MPRSKKFEPFVGRFFAEDKITWQSEIDTLKHIGPFLKTQLNTAGITTLESAILLLTEANDLQQVANIISDLMRSPSVNECKNMDTPNPYLPRAFNRMGFNALADLLHYAARHPEPFTEDVQEKLEQFSGEVDSIRAWLIGTFNENDGDNVHHTPATRAVRKCPCWRTAQTCGADADCQWIPRSAQNPLAGCVPQFMNIAGNMEEVHKRVAPLDIFPNTPAGRAAMQEGDWQIRGVVLPGPDGGFLVRVPIRQSLRAKRRKTGNV